MKMLLIPAALAIAPAAGAAPTSPGSMPDQARAAGTTTVQYRYDSHRRYYQYRTYRNWRGYQYRPYRYNYYGPRCHWSNYWQRTICR